MLWTNIRSTIEYWYLRKKLIHDREAFDRFVYTDVDTAIKQIHRRGADSNLQGQVHHALIKARVPRELCDATSNKLVLFRQLATPNIETSRFLIAADSLEIEPLFLEYYGDKFTANNYTKKYLVIMAFYEGTGKKGGHKVAYFPIMDINQANGKKIEDVVLPSGEKLTDFHHRLFSFSNYHHVKKPHFFDATHWLKQSNGTLNYYQGVLTTCVGHNILFENFVLSDAAERQFVFDVFLKAFIKVKNQFKTKPLIVAISPTEIEHEEFWSCYSHSLKSKVKEHLVQ